VKATDRLVVQRAAELLELEAESLRQCHTIDDVWPAEDEFGAEADYNEMSAVAAKLRAIGVHP
jgi:hypothetical protein